MTAADTGAIIDTPWSIKALMDVVDAEANKLDREVAASTVSPAWKAGWAAFLSEWRNHYKSHSGLFERLWGASFEQAESFRIRLEKWRADFTAQGGKTYGPGTSVDQVFPWRRAALGAGVAALLLVGLRLASRPRLPVHQPPSA